MDPITFGAMVLAAIAAEVKNKATGAAAHWLTEAATERANKLRGVLGEGDAEKLARRAIAEIIGEAAQYPPDEALLVRPLGTVGIAGIWGPRGELKLNLLWVNRADFTIYVRDVRITGKVGGRQCEWDTVLGDEFTLPARGNVDRLVTLEPRRELPSFERGGANCDVSITALVCGPWEEGRAQQTQDLVPLTGIWLPTVGIEPNGVLTEDADIDLVLDDNLRPLKYGERRQVRYAETDRTLGLRAGATKERLAAVAAQIGCTANTGPNVALVHRPHPPSPARAPSDFWARRRGRMDGSAW